LPEKSVMTRLRGVTAAAGSLLRSPLEQSAVVGDALLSVMAVLVRAALRRGGVRSRLCWSSRSGAVSRSAAASVVLVRRPRDAFVIFDTSSSSRSNGRTAMLLSIHSVNRVGGGAGAMARVK
jgi:hypothetical protein